jgi:hypothetical protein
VLIRCGPDEDGSGNGPGTPRLPPLPDSAVVLNDTFPYVAADDTASAAPQAGKPDKPETAAERCDPNYTPCVPIDSDVDCAGGKGNGPSYVRGPVRVVGVDVYGLDADGDGIGCDRRSRRRH